MGAYEQVGCQGTHNEGTSRAEGKGPAGVEVGSVERGQDTDEVETLRLGGSSEIKLPGHSPQTPGVLEAAPQLPVERRAEINTEKLDRT